MKRSNGSWFPRIGGGTTALVLSALLSASVALGLTVPGAVLKTDDPEVPPDNTCPSGYHFENGKCVQIAPPISCPTGYHLEGSSCQPYVAPSCPSGFVYTDGQCVLAQPPAPQPEPEPEPDPAPVVIPFSELHGVNYIDPVLTRNENWLKLPVQKELTEKLVPAAADAGFNVFRIPVEWEAYAGNEAHFLAQLDDVVKTANAHDIFVWIDFHHFYTTSHWPANVSPLGGGFPKFVVSCYKPTNSYERDPEARAFWNDYYLNKVRDSRNSCKGTIDVWQLHADFMKTMIEEVDKHPNVIGYEILNEPHVWKNQDYENLGRMHTAIAKELRESTDKIIIFTRETAHGSEPDGSPYNRRPGLEYKILPEDPANNVMYIPHLYDLNEIEKHVAQWKEVQEKWDSMGYDVKIGVGEWAPQPPQLRPPTVTQSNIDGYVKVWAREGWMHTYWAYGGPNFGEGNVLVKRNAVLTLAGEYYEESIKKFYD